MGNFKELLIQLVRNAIVHGIESPGERQRKMKPAAGVLRIATEIRDNHALEIVVRDDGRGMDLVAIYQQAKDKRLRTEGELQAMDNKALAALIFEPGFSTAGSVDRGVAWGQRRRPLPGSTPAGYQASCFFMMKR